MKEGLIKLIEEADDTCQSYEAFADNLLANGVIVPPVKVGQTVWMVYEGLVYVDNRKWTVGKFAVTMFWADSQEFGYYCKHDNGWTISFTRHDLGKTVFLTKEEAEQALAETKKRQVNDSDSHS